MSINDSNNFHSLRISPFAAGPGLDPTINPPAPLVRDFVAGEEPAKARVGERSHASGDLAPATDYLDEIALAGFPNTQSAAYAVLKRVFDVCFACFAILGVAPLLAIISALIKLTSPGPVLFRQERVGMDGATFMMLKFRTMRVADESFTDTTWRANDDPRRTPIGHLLRRTSMDELPQFLNVIKGDMTVVGPRPERPFFVKRFSAEIPHYNLRHTGRVGITGWAQVHGYRGDTCIQTRLKYDLEYLEKWSFFLDLKVIWLTIKRIFISDHE